MPDLRGSRPGVTKLLDGTPPGAPTGLVLVRSGDSATLSWSAVSGATSYEVSVDGAVVATPAGTTATVDLGSGGPTVAVAAKNASGVSAGSRFLVMYDVTSRVCVGNTIILQWTTDEDADARTSYQGTGQRTCTDPAPTTWHYVFPTACEAGGAEQLSPEYDTSSEIALESRDETGAVAKTTVTARTPPAGRLCIDSSSFRNSTSDDCSGRGYPAGFDLDRGVGVAAGTQAADLYFTATESSGNMNGITLHAPYGVVRTDVWDCDVTQAPATGYVTQLTVFAATSGPWTDGYRFSNSFNTLIVKTSEGRYARVAWTSPWFSSCSVGSSCESLLRMVHLQIPYVLAAPGSTTFP